MQDRSDALAILVGWTAVAVPIAIGIASVAGWRVAGAALRPVDRLRREAAAVSVSGLDRRLTVSPPEDELARLARTLNDMLDRLHDAFEGERHFLDVASHELRSPLAALRAELDLATSRPRSVAELTAALASAAEEANRLSRLADDLLLLSRARRGRLSVHRRPTALASLLATARDRATPRAAERDVMITSGGPDVTVQIDEMRIRQALDNLIDNALRATPNGGLVSVRAYLEGTAVRVEITDTGPGFPRAVVGVGDSNDAESGASVIPRGAGLGLAIVRAVADGHDGTLTIGRTPAGGGLVTMTLADAISSGSRRPDVSSTADDEDPGSP